MGIKLFPLCGWAVLNAIISQRGCKIGDENIRSYQSESYPHMYKIVVLSAALYWRET